MYNESIVMSHAYGYLYYSNDGTFADDVNVLLLTDHLLLLMLKKIELIYSVSNKDEYLIIKSIVHSCINEIEALINKKK